MSEYTLPLTRTQQGIYLDACVKNSGEYNLSIELEIDPLDTTRVAVAVAQVLREQPATRSVVRSTAEGVVFVVGDSDGAAEKVYRFEDLRGRAREQDGIVERTRLDPFDLDHGPLLRVVHCKGMSGDRLVIACHHLIADGISLALIAERVLQLATGEPGAVADELDTGFENYQRAGEAPEKRAARAESYWRSALQRQEVPELARWTDGLGDSARGHDTRTGRELRRSIPADVVAAIKALSRELEVSEYTVYLATFGFVLARATYAEQLSVATVFTDRPKADMESSVGCFIKALPVLLAAHPELTVAEGISRAREEIFGAWKHLDVALGALVHEVAGAERLFDVTFIHDVYPEHPDGVRGTVARPYATFAGTLTVLVEQVGDKAQLVVQYAEPMISATLAASLADQLITAFSRVPEVAEEPIGALFTELTPSDEGAISALEDTHFFDAPQEDLATLFVQKCLTDPARIAWTDSEHRYSNAWAYDQAVSVQQLLNETAGERGRAVGILMPRSVQLLGSVFGTVLADRPYVPLPLQAPLAVLEQIVDDAEIGVVLTLSDIDRELPAGVTRVDVDRHIEADDLERVDPTGVVAPITSTADSVLYIEYTSGSTGRPKGVVVQHSGIVNAAADLERRFPLRSSDVYLLKTAFTFDIFGTEIYGWLLGAGTLAVLPEGQEGDPLALLTTIRDTGATHLNFSPTMLRVMLDTAERTARRDDLAGVRYVFCGGEALSADVVERFFAAGLTASLENVYGPTEASMWATHAHIEAHHGAEVEIPIGTPLNDNVLHVIDRYGNRCGANVPGELCIAGAGLAVGYLNRDELNASQFVVDPYLHRDIRGARPGDMYRTGDLGVMRPDGTLVWIERIDSQAKVGGVRIELGAIEQAMLGVDGVRDAAAVVLAAPGTPPAVAACVVGDGSGHALRVALRERLMPHEIPAKILFVEAIPSSSAGKRDRRAMAAMLQQAPVESEASATAAVTATAKPAVSETAPTAEVVSLADAVQRIRTAWRRVLGHEDFTDAQAFFDVGGNSLALIELQRELSETIDGVSVAQLMRHTTVQTQATLAAPSVAESADAAEVDVAASVSGDIAIIGIGLQAPGAEDVHEFWEQLVRGEEGITFFSDEELRGLGITEQTLRDPKYVKARGRLPRSRDGFDHRLFEIPPAEADATSPQLRLLYECFWRAWEDAGYNPLELPGRVGVYVGGNDDFAWYRRALREDLPFGEAYENFTLASNHFLATRLSYHFDLTGPSMAALTGCSSSLLTVHLAVQALRSGECETAVAGGVTVELPDDSGYEFVDGMMLSPDGRCRPFDAAAQGTMFTNGAALLVLKPVAAALRDGDSIYAVIKGTAAGNDGGRKLSYTAPSEDGQVEVIRQAYRSAGIDPSTIEFIEAHGTGTLLGDPIEVASLTRVFGESAAGSCVLGSVKGNVGHTDSAAGAMGLAKAALAVKHRFIPGTKHFDRANPHIDFAQTPFRVGAAGEVWDSKLRRAGVNSFGVGGTNVHAIVEQPPAYATVPEAPRDTEVLQFSAASATALHATVARVGRYLEEHPEVSLQDAAFTLRHGRAVLPYRRAIAVRAQRNDGAIASNWSAAQGEHLAQTEPRLALMFPGQGNQYPGMGRALAASIGESGDAFRNAIDEVLGYLDEVESTTLRALLAGEDPEGLIHQTQWSQLALFATQYAVAKVFEQAGVVPDVLIGHSIGELTAATLAGVWELGDAVRIVRERGRLMQSQEPGTMIAVLASADAVTPLIDQLDGVWLSLDNSSQRCVLGMRKELVETVTDLLDEHGLIAIALQTSHAFHTPLMSDAAERFAAWLVDIPMREPSIPILSNQSGIPATTAQLTSPDYWAAHITDTVQFRAGLQTLLSDGPIVGVEIGPGQSLASFVAHEDAGDSGHTVVGAIGAASDADEDALRIAQALGELWALGVPVHVPGAERGRRVSLPGYVFDELPHPLGLTSAHGTAGESVTASQSGTDAAPRRTETIDVAAAVRSAFTYVLGHEDIDDNDDFFVRGGDSLKATALIARLHGQHGIDLTVADVFAAPQPAALALRAGASAAAVLPVADDAADYPLTAAQRRMFVAARIAPDDLVYNMTSVTALDNVPDATRMRTALERLVARHEPLRTTFDIVAGEARQRIGDGTGIVDAALRWESIDAGDERTDAELAADFARPFDLASGPLFRVTILEHPGRGVRLLFDIHHIIADATAVEILTRDFALLYEQELPSLRVQHRDFAVWAEQQPVDEEREARLAERLSGASTEPLIPARVDASARTGEASRVSLHLDGSHRARVKRIAESHRSTPFMVVLAAWSAVFRRLRDADDMVIGIPATGRTLAETEEMVGMFVNMLPVRLQVSPEQQVDSHLADVRTAMIDAVDNQDIAFDRVVDRLGIGGVQGRHPLFDVSIDYHNMRHHDLGAEGLTGTAIELAPTRVALDLVITCLEADDALELHLDYAVDVHERRAIEEIAQHFTAVLEQFDTTSTARIDELSLWTNSERTVFLPPEPAPFVAIHDRIRERALLAPDAVGIIDVDGTVLTAGTVDAMANAQAARLVSAGLEPGELVALMAPRDAGLLIAQLAILKAGGAYLPIDPTQPEARRAQMLEDVQPRFAFAAADAEIPGVVVFDTANYRHAQSEVAPELTVDAEQPAYVIYTSGSTGTPKGILVPHRGLSNLYADHAERELFAPGDVIISLADPTFDIFAFESVIALASGAAVHITPQSDQKDVARVAERIAAYGVTHVQLPVSKMAAFCGNRAFRDRLRDLRVIVCGGEHFPDALAERIDSLSDARLFNMYGPTEATVTSTVHEVTPGTELTVGTAISGASVVTVSPQGRIQPIGVPGEVCVLGAGLAKGYVKRPELTAAAFTEIADLPGVPVYRTGDLGVRRASGALALSGRLDHQVKFNGNRIELGELEKAAMSLAELDYAVAAVEGDELVLYVVCAAGIEQSKQELNAVIRQRIAETVPASAHPTVIHRLSAMPELANGKVDRRALAALRSAEQTPELRVEPAAQLAASVASVSASNVHRAQDLVAVISELWAEVLGRTPAPGDNFFEVGGNSYKLMLVNNALTEKLGRDIPLTLLFEHSSPRALAAALTDGIADQSAPTDARIAESDLDAWDDWSEPQPSTDGRIAIIGMSAVLPGADSVQEHWRGRMAGEVSTTRLSEQQLRDAGIDEATIADPRYVPVRGVVDANTFDADFFGYSAQDARAMDPQLRLLHETAWHALEDGGYLPGDETGAIGLYAGSGTNFAWMAGLVSGSADDVSVYEAMTINEKDFLASRVAHKLNLTGPAVTVQTACSTSLVAVHHAVAALRSGEAELALAGGVALNFPRHEGYLWREGMIFSRDGVCRPFSDDANGTVPGQGCGMVLLKPYERAVADGDHIYAVIAGSAVNNDGNTKIGYTAPSSRGQQQVMRRALDDAGISPERIGYIEAHGTGTALGDPIEYAALAEVYGAGAPTAIGAVKANIGHLDAAAGIVGLIGAATALAQQEIPPMANFTALSSELAAAPGLVVPTAADRTGGLAAAAVSSFGIGGTNAHVVLERAPEASPEPKRRQQADVLALSAHTVDALTRMRAELATAVNESNAADASFTLAHGRASLPVRAAAVVTAGVWEWHDSADAPFVVAADDSESLTIAVDTDADSPMQRWLAAGIEAELALFDEQLAARIRTAISDPVAPSDAVGRLAQFAIRAAMTRLLGAEALRAVPGQDRLVRIAQAWVDGRSDANEVLAQLRTGRDVPTGVAGGTGPATVLAGVLSPSDVRRLVTSQWVHGRTVPLRVLASEGRRISLPGSAFARTSVRSDIRLDELRGTRRAEPVVVATGVDETLAQLWEEVLGAQPGPDADFLRGGGDSLGAVRLIGGIADRLGVQMSVADVFADPTFAAILAHVRNRAAEQPLASVIENKSTAEASCPLTTTDTAGEYPTTVAQQRLYAACELADDPAVYNLGVAYEVSGSLDPQRLRSALHTLLAHHAQLRATFHLNDGVLVQRVSEQIPDVLTVTEVDAASAERIAKNPPKAFDLATGPLLRVELLMVDGRPQYVLIDMHHLIGDQASLGILADDIARILTGDEAVPVGMSYPQFVAAAARRDDDPAVAASRTYFSDLVAQAPEPLALLAPEAVSQPGARGRRVSRALNVGRDDLAAVARAAGVTEYSVFLTAVTRVLGLHSGQREMMLGTAVSGRSLPGTERTVGLFVTTVPLLLTDRADLDLAAAAQLTTRVVATTLENLAQAGDPHSGATDGESPFEVLFNFVAADGEALSWGEATLTPLETTVVASRYPLSLSVAVFDDHYTVDLEYRADIVEPATVALIAEHLDRLLGALAAGHSGAIGAVSLETADERAQRRAALTAPGAEYADTLLSQLCDSFDLHAAEEALRWESESWTYAEVDALTDRIAGGLQGVGIGVGDVVACVLPRGPWQIFARLALLKTGAIEVPVDPAAPTQRIEEILRDSDAVAVLTEEELVFDALGPQQFAPAALEGNYTPPQELRATDPIIMIYTSGTTGTPKGTLVPGSGILSTCRDNGYMSYKPGDRVLQLTGYTFDPSLLDIYSALLAGATLVMGAAALATDTAALAEWLAKHEVDAGILITAVFHLVMAERPEALAGMRAVYVGGEAMQPWAAQRAVEVLGPERLFNLYGPTEASVCTTFYRVDAAPQTKHVPIGYPAHARTLFIVHPDGTDVPQGVPGELCVTGPSVALGYHGRPELTSDRFVELVAAEGDRAYRTGDRVVLDADGAIRYLGRIDRQIKHAGHRIELDEIEAVVRTLPGVNDAVVLHSVDDDSSRLTAFVTGTTEVDGLRETLAALLPSHMIPQHFLAVPSLPLTSHGKVDRRALQHRADALGDAVQSVEPAQPTNGVAQVNSVEGLVLSELRRALGDGQLGDSDNFFEAGGHSIQAISAVRRLREAGHSVEVSDLYRYPSAQALATMLAGAPAAASVIETARSTLTAPRAAHLVRQAVRDAVEVAEQCGGESAAAVASDYEITLSAAARFHRAAGTDTGGFIDEVTGSADAVAAAIARMAERHEALRTYAVDDDNAGTDTVGVLAPSAVETLEWTIARQDFRDVDMAQAAALAEDILDALMATSFARGLLWRCVVIQIATDRTLVVWSFQHSVFDGRSAGIIRDEMRRELRGAPPAPVQDYSRFLGQLPLVIDWPAEQAKFDYVSWIDGSEQALQQALLAPKSATERFALRGENAFTAAMRAVWERLRGDDETRPAAVAVVNDCRRWGSEDFSGSIGEFLDAVPVMLTEEDAALSARLEQVREDRVHFIDALARWEGDDREIRRMRDLYYTEDGVLDVVLVNFQGFIPAEARHSEPDAAPALARVQVNVWHDDEDVHLEWLLRDRTAQPESGGREHE